MFTETIDKIINGLQTLKTDLMVLENRITQLEMKQKKDDAFFSDLEKLVTDRNRTY